MRRLDDTHRPPAPFGIRPAGGFTLVEIMAAVAIAAIVLGVLFGVLGDLRTAMVKADKRSLPSNTAQQLFTTVVNDIESAFIPNSGKLAFYATRDDRTVRFLSTCDSAITPAGRQGDNIEVAYIAVDTSEGVSLFRRESVFIDDKPLQGGHLTLLAAGLQGFAMEFYDGTQWREEWNNLGSEARSASDREHGLPRAIRIRLVTKDGSEFSTAIEPLRMSLGVK